MKQKSRGVFWKYRFVFIPLAVLVVAEILVQVFYPSSKMLPIAYIDGMDVGGRNRQEIVNELNKKYNNADVEIFFGNNVRPTFVVKPHDLGVKIGNADRVNSTNYKWYLKLIPTSLFWAGLIPPSADPTIKSDSVSVNIFVAQKLGDSCNIKPVNAIPKVEGDNLVIVKQLKGGSCDIADVKKSLTDINYQADVNKIRIPMEEFDADITDDMARELAIAIGTKLQRDVLMSTENGEKFFIPGEKIMSWLEFSVVNNKLTVTIDKKKSGKYYEQQIAPKVTSKAGTTVLTTNNLTDTIRENGSEGKVLNIDETNKRLVDFLLDERQTITLALDTIYPNIIYTSRFKANSKGLSALIKYYAQIHDGDYGVVLYELGKKERTASYNADKKFSVAGAARMILAYTMLDRHEQGLTITEEDDIFGCIDNVINSFNLTCVDYSVFGNMESSLYRLDLYNTSIENDEIVSTAGDLGQFLQRLYNRRLGLTYENNQILYSGLKTAIPRNGISGAIGINNLNATGNLGNNLSDAAIVFTYDTKYVLVILTKGASWQNIAELANQIQGLMSK